jgi:putative addiction module CopG family antidote
MKLLLGKHLEQLVEQQVKAGVYQNKNEVVRDAVRHLLLEDDADDTELLAECLREAKASPRKPYTRGEFRKLAAKAAATRRTKAKRS